MSNEANNLYEFGDFRFDAEANTLWRGEARIALSPKALELLKLLVERGGEIVSKREIFDRVWADTFVEDGVLTQNIYTLRNALGTDADGRQFIENVARRGYRFAAPLKTLRADKAVSENGRPSDFLFNGAKSVSAEFAENRPHSSAAARPSNGSHLLAANQIPFVSASAQKNRRRPAFRYAFFIGCGVLIAAALGFAIYQFAVRRDERRESKTAPIEQLRVQRLTDSGDVIHPSISPNGEMLVYVRQEEGGESLWVKQMATGNSVRTLPPSLKGYRSLVFSPDGNYLFFKEDATATAIYQTSPFGGTPKKVIDNVWSDFSISPDGKRFAFFRRSPDERAHLLILSNADGSGERELSARTLPLTYRGGAPAWSPDGKNLIVSGGSSVEARPLLLKIDTETGQETELSGPRWRGITHFLWMPDGANLIVTARAADEPVSQIWMLGASGGEVRRLTNDLENYFWISLSADGRKLVSRQQVTVSRLWLLPGGNPKKAEQITFGERNHDGIRGLAWTADKRIVFTGLTDTIADLYAIDPDGSSRTRLTVNAGQDNTYPMASADGRYIVFTSHRSGGRQIWRMDADGRNQKQLTFGEEPKESAYSAAVSPDSKEVYFIRAASSPAAIWKVSIDGGEPLPVSRLNDATAQESLAISPDGKWLVYRHISAKREIEIEESTQRVGVLPTTGDAEPKLFDLPLRRPLIQWASDSSGFYYVAGTPNASSLQMQPLDSRDGQKLIDFPDRIFNFAWSPDGKDLVVARGRQQGDAILITNLP